MKEINKNNDSEYDIENNFKCRIEIDDEKLTKYYDIYYASSNFDLDEDIKLSAKSLSLKYCLSKINKILISDEFLQLKSMLNLLSMMLSEEELLIESVDITPKVVVKLLKMFVLKDGFNTTSNNMSYDELILLQLKMIKECIDYSRHTLLFIDLMYLSKPIYDFINQLTDICVIVICQIREIDINSNNIYFNGIDLEDEQALYERMMLMSNFYDLNEYTEFCKTEFLKNT